MLYMIFQTNLKYQDFEKSWILDVSKLLSTVSGRKEESICVRPHTDQVMTLGGSSDPCGVAHVSTTDQVDDGLNRELAAKLTELFGKTLKLPPNRVYVNFDQIPKGFCAINGILLSSQ